jgi:hypothetical protein
MLRRCGQSKNRFALPLCDRLFKKPKKKQKTIEALLLRHSKIAAVLRGEWSPQPRVTQSHSIFNSNKQNIEGKHGCLAFGGRAG